jgi:uncharacterized FAD-dependent dehydrogenase
MAINTDELMNDDAPQSGGKGSGGAASVAGTELAMAVAGRLQQDTAEMMALAAQCNDTVNSVAGSLADYFVQVLSGQTLMGAVMERLSQVKPMAIKTDIDPIDISELLPKRTDADLVERFKAFSAGIQPPALRLPAAYGGTNED